MGEIRTSLLDHINTTNESVIKENPSLLLAYLKEIQHEILITKAQRRQIIYHLVNSGLEINLTDEDENTALHMVLLHHNGDIELSEPILQCGADLHLANKDGKTPWMLQKQLQTIPPPATDMVQKYWPGLWFAVEKDDLMAVRRLVNLWSRVDLKKDGKTLKSLALDKGTEHIIRLIKDIQPSMQLAHYAMGGDLDMVKQICSAKDVTVNTNFKNMGDMGATPLFYGIMQNSVEIVECLINKGAKISTTIAFQDEDIPIYFAALNKESDPEMLKLLTPPREKNDILLHIHYKGSNVLHYCIENNVPVNCVRVMLQQGYPELVASRNTQNKSARDIAEETGKSQYMAVIDEVVHVWCLESSECRKQLALLGYDHITDSTKDGVKVYEVIQTMETSSDQAKFDTQLETYQNQISKLHEAIVNSEFDKVYNLITYTGEHRKCFHTCLAIARVKGDGQPILISAVLTRSLPVVEAVCESLASTKTSIDSVRDPYYRTALHYAYGLQDSTDIVHALMEFGSSEFTMDKDGRSPLVFKDYAGQPKMEELLNYHRRKDYSSPEPDPWTSQHKLTFQQCENHDHGDKSTANQSDLQSSSCVIV